MFDIYSLILLIRSYTDDQITFNELENRYCSSFAAIKSGEIFVVQVNAFKGSKYVATY
jgi:hypothetical protein